MSASLKTYPRVDDWIRLDTPQRVTLRSGKVEIGQRINTALIMTAAAELSIDPSRIQVNAVITDDAPDEGMTSGSNSIEQSAEAIRLAALSARRHLIALAALALDRRCEDLFLVDGLVRERDGNRSASFWELLPSGRFEIDVDVDAREPAALLKEDQATILREQRAARLACGEQQFIHDYQAHDLLHVRVVRPPHAAARLLSINEAQFSVTDGISLVRNGSFLAVAAADEFQAVRSAARLADAACWDCGVGIDDRDVFARLRDDPAISLAVIDGMPTETPLADERKTPGELRTSARAVYERGYQMHGSIGPSAAMARMSDGVLQVWSHSQGIYPLRASLAELLELPTASVRVQHVMGAGCYGHNGADDAALDAALVARALPQRTVLVKWSRDDEHAWEPYASAMAVELSASVNVHNRIVNWSHDTYSDTHGGRPRPGAGGVGPARLLAAQWLQHPPAPFVASPNRQSHGGIHRNADPYYEFDERRIVKHLVRGLPLRTSAMRTLGGFMNVFAIESFIDELANGAAVDPLALRLAHLRDSRAIDLLQWVAEDIGWVAGDTPAASAGQIQGQIQSQGQGKGIAFARYKNRQAYVAVAVEVVVDDAAQIHLKRAVIAVDAGRVIDRDGITAQMEGGFLQAASWTLYERVQFDANGVTSRDWDSYPILRFDNIPEITVHIAAANHQPPLGAGEAACGPAGAAIANAVFNAVGLRVRRLPLNPDALRAAAAL
jgi:nicotinate dehydrogenase subunit B